GAGGVGAASGVIRLDVVLGYGSHPDPAGALVPALQEARARAASAGRSVLVIASVCGTASDPQDLVRQERQLRDAGVRLAPSNAEAARQAALAVRDTGHSGESRRGPTPAVPAPPPPSPRGAHPPTPAPPPSP